MRSFIKEQGLYLSFAVALIATLGSLYFSEILGHDPCTYCWYNRILMYPLVLLLGIAAVRKDTQIVHYVIPFSFLGIVLSTYHYLTQKVAWLSDNASTACGLIPCNTQYIDWFGFITIPFLALIAHVIIFLLQFLLWRATK